MSTTTEKPTIVLVHGAWADASSFRSVTERLQRHGYTVLAPPNPLRGIATDTKTIVDFVSQSTTGPVVLVGHSYGGVVITGAARELSDVRALVYVDAFAPASGESVIALTNQLPGSVLNVANPADVFDFVLPSPDAAQGDYDSYIKRGRFHDFFAEGLPPHDAAALASGQRPAMLAALAVPFTGEPAWSSIPSWFFIGTADQVIPVAQQRAMAARAGGTIVEVDAPHLAMPSRPREVSDLIIAAAEAA